MSGREKKRGKGKKKKPQEKGGPETLPKYKDAA